MKVNRALTLLEKRKDILRETPERALDMILGSELPAELVQSFSHEDLYFLIHEIGYGDAIPVLALATSEQWGYMLDVDVWNLDRLDADAVTRWLKLLLLADGERAIRWLFTERLEFIELYLFRHIDVIVREENQDPSDFPDDFFTYDDYFYVRIRKLEEVVPGDGDEMVRQEDREEVLRAFIEHLVSMDHRFYQQVMLESMTVVPAEVEEEDFRWRNARLSEKGYQSFDEALRIYAPIQMDDTDRLKKDKELGRGSDPEPAMSPLSHVGEVKDENQFTRALAMIDEEQELQALQMEFASLCNLIISADRVKIRERKDLGAIVTKACGYVSIGLELMTDTSVASMENASDMIRHYRLETLFRVGFGAVADLKKRAERIKKEGWFMSRKLPLSFWGEEWLGVLGGLLVARPLCFDNYKTGVLYRDFVSMEDISATSSALDAVKRFDDLLSILAPDTDRFEGYFLTCYNLILTQWVNHRCGRDKDSGPLPLHLFKDYFNALWEPESDPLRIRTDEKTQLLAWLADETGLTELEISEQIGGGLEAMFVDFESEYASVTTENLDARYIHHVCLEQG